MILLWQQIPNLTITDILTESTFDGLVIDTEHGMFDVKSIAETIALCIAKDKQCFIRTHPEDTFLSRYLDCGITGLIFSTITSAAQALKIEQMCYYPPDGKRGQGLVRQNRWGRDELGINDLTLIAQIETVEAVDRIKSIAECNVFDYFMIGPYDLSASLGCVGNFKSKVYKRAVKKIKNAVGQDTLGYHIVSDVEKQYVEYKKCGMLALSMDTMYLTKYVEDMQEIFRRN